MLLLVPSQFSFAVAWCSYQESNLPSRTGSFSFLRSWAYRLVSVPVASPSCRAHRGGAPHFPGLSVPARSITPPPNGRTAVGSASVPQLAISRPFYILQTIPRALASSQCPGNLARLVLR
ncbi:hypothetical protein DFP72DRAFT_237370 [Ephemerocybe angulata]|uniref:Uncharacterized protein n=1 Tax=Ephemerocybe angulata TaxID=980116 RepID=A0A8H6I415_9AGAR|nr:hypothetical protein DFP72DRAFT_237370 [Tulosesus angulatus]